MSAEQSRLLLVGSGELADSLAPRLGGRSVVVERAARSQAAATVDVRAPHLVVLAGDAVHDRGVAVAEQLRQTDRKPLIPVLVICTPELDGLTLPPAAHHVGYLAHEGAVSDCARRVHAILDLLLELGLSACSLQQLVDTVAPRKSKASTTKQSAVAPPNPPEPKAHTPRSIMPAVASANRAATDSQATELRSAQVARSIAPVVKPVLNEPAAPPAIATTATATPSVAPGRRSQKPLLTASVAKPALDEPAPPLVAAPSIAPGLDSQLLQPASAASAASDPPAVPPAGSATVASASSTTPERQGEKPPVPAPVADPDLREPVPAPVSLAGAVLAPPRAPERLSPKRMPAVVATPALREAARPPVPAATAAVAPSRGQLKPPPPASLAKPALKEPAQAMSPTPLLARPAAAERAPSSIASSSFEDPGFDDAEPTEVWWREPSPTDVAQPSAVTRPAPPNASDLQSASVEPETEMARTLAPPKPAGPTFRPEPAFGEVDEPTIVHALGMPAAQPSSDAAPQRLVSPSQLAVSAGALEARGAQQRAPHAPAQPTRSARDSADPLEAAPLGQSAAQPRLAEPSPSWNGADSKRRRHAVALCASAAVGGAMLLLRWLYAGADHAEASAAAMGSLQHAVIVETTPERVAVSEPKESPRPTTAPVVPEPSAAPPPNASSEVVRSSDSGRDAAQSPLVIRAQALVEEATVQFKQGQLGAAEQACQKALETIRDYVPAMALLARVHLARHDGAEALRWATRVVTQRPGSAYYQLLLGDAHALRGERKAARAAWEKAALMGNDIARRRLQ